MKYLDGKIETDIQFFNEYNVLDENMIKLNAIKTQLRQKEKLIDKMELEKLR